MLEICDFNMSVSLETKMWTLLFLATMVQGNPFSAIVSKRNASHYGDPFARNCLYNEQNISVEGIPGWFCSPLCTFEACPKDLPSGVSAKPSCDIQNGVTGNLLCGLVCNSSKQCGYNATCNPIADTALCTYSI